MPKPQLTAGRQLQLVRQSMGLTLRDVYRASARLARRLNDDRFVIPISRLHDIESKSATPNIYRLYALAHVYEFDLRDLLVLYGVPQ